MTQNQQPHPTANSGSTGAELQDIATEQLGKVAHKVEAMASIVADSGRDAGERVNAVAGNIKGAVDKSVKDQPMATLAMAVLMGFVLGALWKS